MRIAFVVSVFVVVWALLIFRIYQIGIKSNTYYDELAKRNTIKVEDLVPVRGLILDRHGEPLAVNRLGFKIALKPKLSKKKSLSLLQDELNFIQSYFPDLDIQQMEKHYKRYDSPYNHAYITVVDFVSYERMQPYYATFFQRDRVRVLPATKRYYPNHKIASHLIGYVGKANSKEIKGNTIAKLSGFVGKSGLEKQYNTFLEGTLGYRKVKVTAFNREIEEIEKKHPSENNNLILALDLRLQKRLHALFGEKSGAGIILDVHTGEILAAGSYPEYDTNHFVDGISHKNWQALITNLHHPFTNKLIHGLYPPGSVIKPAVSLAFLEYGGIDENEQIFCPPEIEMGGRKFRDWKKEGHGRVDLYKAIKRSADVYFYINSQKTGIHKIARVLKQTGFGSKTGVDLPNEFIGVVPTPEWKQKRYRESWYLGETLIASIGQGYFLVTPLQVARHTAVLATGKMVTPHLVQRLGSHSLEYNTTGVLNDFQKKKIYAVRKGMYQVCNEEGGTAYWHLRQSRFHSKVAGKTGTAQVVGIPQEEKERMDEKEMAYFHRSHAWLTVYVPYEAPKYAITVMVEHGGHGGESAGPIVGQLLKSMETLNYL
jgi:penicillin-binding protein 2